jgi:hypothetical protein
MRRSATLVQSGSIDEKTGAKTTSELSSFQIANSRSKKVKNYFAFQVLVV